MKPTPIQYRVDLSSPAAREVRVGMKVDLPDAGPLEVFLPQMSPGSPVASQGHPGQLTSITATDAAGEPVKLEKTGEGAWKLDAKGPVTMHYTLKANEFSDVRAYLTPDMGYLNGPDVLLCVKGHEHDTPATIALDGIQDPSWKSSSTLPRVLNEPHTFYAASYDDAADDNIMVGRFKDASAKAGDVTLHVVQEGDDPYVHLQKPGATPEENVHDFARIYRAFIHDFGPFPKERFLATPQRPEGVEQDDQYTVQKQYVNSGPDATDGLEHFRGHELIRHKDSEGYIHSEFGDSARRNENYTMAHEVVHKMLAKSVQHEGIDASDLSRLHSTDGLWLTEGVTNWTGYMLERQSGLMTPQQFLDRWQGAIDSYYKDYAMEPTNARDDSLQAQEGNGRYYNKGSIMGLALDLELRHLSQGQTGLTDVLRNLKSEFGNTGRYTTLADIERLTADAAAPFPGGRARIEGMFQDHLVDRKRIEVDQYLNHVGLQLGQRTDRWPERSMNRGGAELVCDSSGVPGIKLDPDSKLTGEPFAIPFPSMGIEVMPDLTVTFVGRGSPAAVANLHYFRDQKPDQVLLRTAAGDVDVQHPERSTEPGEVKSMVFRYPGNKEVVVPCNPQPQMAIEEMPNPTPEQLSRREEWLAQLPESVVG